MLTHAYSVILVQERERERGKFVMLNVEDSEKLNNIFFMNTFHIDVYRKISQKKLRE